ncbi:MAG: Na/Pi cotransporter family protein [Acidiferrobacterales bacterium]
MILQILTGIGLFLLGMVILTDGLKSLAGDAMRAVLIRFTHTPYSGALTGALTTGLLQSSSATTVAAVGFVGAQLITYPMALGIVLGANVGTTITGWLVVLLGFKLQLDTILPPLILFGVALRLFTKGQLGKIGMTLAGFALIFVGIAALQQGMGGLEKHITPDSFPPDSVAGRIQLVLLGVLITLVTQSSSVGVVMALTALYAGAINFPQAASLVIGMNIGTTATAALATIGASASSRRTGLSHVTFNIVTAIGAFILLSPFIYLLQSIAPDWFQRDPELALVAFHTGFNILGVIVILPFTRQFAKWMMKLVPETDSVYSRALDMTLLKEPGVALGAAQAAIAELCIVTFQKLRQLLGDSVGENVPSTARLHLAVSEALAYIDRIHFEHDKHPAWEHLIESMHALDHLKRLLVRCDETRRATLALRVHEIDEARHLLSQSLQAAVLDIRSGQTAASANSMRAALPNISQQTEQARGAVMALVAEGKLDVADATNRLEAIRWLQRSGEHVARITSHLEMAVS